MWLALRPLCTVAATTRHTAVWAHAQGDAAEDLSWDRVSVSQHSRTLIRGGCQHPHFFVCFGLLFFPVRVAAPASELRRFLTRDAIAAGRQGLVCSTSYSAGAHGLVSTRVFPVHLLCRIATLFACPMSDA